MSDVSACFDDVIAGVTRTLAAVDDAASSLRPEASGVRRMLEVVFSPRRLSGPGIAAYASDVARTLQDATIAYVTGDEEMASQTTAASSRVSSSYRRGTGSVIF